MTVDIRNPQGQPLTTADRSNAIAESLRQVARVSRFADRKKGIRSYQSHVKTDPYVPIFFVLFFLIPTLIGGGYYGVIASDRFISEARFAIRPAVGSVEKASPDQIGTSSGVANPMTAQDTLITANYIESRTMVEVMEGLMPLRAMFSRDSIDILSRFDPDKPIEKLMKYWRERVDVKVDAGSGFVSLTVNTFDPAESLTLAQAILTESERMVNALSARSRDDALKESGRELKIAGDRLKQIQIEVAALRNRDGVLDAQKTNEANLKVVSELRATRINLAVQMTLSQRDLGPDTRRIQDMKSQIKELDDNIAKIERQSASQDPEQRKLLSGSLTRFEALDNERKDAATYYGKVIAANERARIIADRQIEFFTMIVEPVMAQSSQQPRRLLMICLIAAGSAVAFVAAVFTRKQIAA